MTSPVLVVMAAGIGSRYGGLKQIDPVGPNNEIILDYSLHDALRAGFGEVIFVINRDMEEVFRDRIGTNIEKRCKVTYVFQRLDDVPEGFGLPQDRQKPWGTAHAVLSCRQVVKAPFAVINADDFYGHSSFQSLFNYLKNAQNQNSVLDLCMVGYTLRNTLSKHGHVARGICTVDPDGFLVDVRERTRIGYVDQSVKYTEDGDTWIEIGADSIASMNMWGFTPGLLEELEARFPCFLQTSKDNLQKAEFLLPDAVNDLLKVQKATVKVLPTHDLWFGVTYQQDKPRVRKAILNLIQSDLYPDNLWE